MPRQPARATTQENSSNLLSNVFSFVSREFDSFVSNATGRPPREVEEDDDDEEYDDGEDDEDETPRASSSRSQMPERETAGRGDKKVAGKHRRTCEDADEVRPRKLPARSRSRQRGSNSGHGRRERAKCDVMSTLAPSLVRRRPGAPEEDEEELAGSERSRTPSPKPRSSVLRHKRSFTMPGALYDRTSSLEPSPEPDEDRHRVVRFASEVTTSPSPRRQPVTPRNQAEEAAPSSGRKATPHAHRQAQMSDAESSSEDEQRMPSSPTKRVSRPRRNSFVQEAIRLRSAEKNPDVSLLLPRSPVVSCSPPSKDKGKEKARAALEVINLEDSDDESNPEQEDDRSERADISVRTRVRGKERELHNARQQEQEREDDEERRRDKERIRALEEELRKLREELAKRPVASQPYAIPPPPPPPPPPRPAVLSRPHTNQAETTFAGVRASLRHAGTPVEKPINPAYGGPSVRKGQPTINLDGDRMAAFLNELKSHRLKRVGTSVSESHSQPAIRAREVGDVGNRTEFAIRPREIEEIGNQSEFLPRPNRSFAISSVKEGRRHNATISRRVVNISESDTRVGEKRKHVDSSHEEAQEPMPSKRRAIAAPLLSANSSADSFMDLSIPSTSRNRLPMRTERTNDSVDPTRVPVARANRTGARDTSFSRVLSGLRAETEITTPSLSSDNENENVSNESLEGQSPPTPPPEEAVAAQEKSTTAQTRSVDEGYRADEDEADEVDVGKADEYEHQPQQGKLRTFPRNRGSPQSAGTFSRRQPASPKLLDSPRRPRAPARTRAFKEVRQVEVYEDDMDLQSFSYESSNAPSYAQAHEELEESHEHGRGQQPITAPESLPIRLPMRPPPGTFKQPPKQKTNLPSRLPVRKGSAKNLVQEASRGPLNMNVSSLGPSSIRRRDSLDAELRRADAEYDAEVTNEDVQLESGTLSGIGTRNRKRGFLAFGGAAGRPAIVDDGMLQDLDNLVTSDDEIAQPSRRMRRASSSRRV